jgi:transposase
MDSEKLNSSNLGAVMKNCRKIGHEGIIDVCIERFNRIKHLETESSTLIYDITSTYFYSTKLPKARLGYSRDNNSLPQINIGLVATKNKGLPVLFRTYEGNITDVRTVEQLIANLKRVNLSIDAIIMDRGMASKNNLIKLNGDNLKMIAGIPLTSNEAKELVMRDISKENELMRPSGLIYYEDVTTSLFGIPDRAIICFNHSDLEIERTARLKKIGIAEIKVAEILSSQTGNETLESLEKEIKEAIHGVSYYFEIINDGKKITVNPHAENRGSGTV